GCAIAMLVVGCNLLGDYWLRTTQARVE
ncbi:hypothetical protein, partial [Cronobacter sakazakii]